MRIFVIALLVLFSSPTVYAQNSFDFEGLAFFVEDLISQSLGIDEIAVVEARHPDGSRTMLCVLLEGSVLLSTIKNENLLVQESRYNILRQAQRDGVDVPAYYLATTIFVDGEFTHVELVLASTRSGETIFEVVFNTLTTTAMEKLIAIPIN